LAFSRLSRMILYANCNQGPVQSRFVSMMEQFVRIQWLSCSLTSSIFFFQSSTVLLIPKNRS
jgi:hypothetical protein